MIAAKIAQRVHALLETNAMTLGSFTFSVPVSRIYREEDLWYVFVEPDSVIEKQGQFYDVLNDIEEQIEKEDHENVLIVPLQPRSSTPAAPRT